MSGEVTAVDVLVLPDAASVGRLRALNDRLLATAPGAFALDGTHRAHVSLLHRYVRTANLDETLDAVAEVTASVRSTALRFEAVGVYHVEWGGRALASVRFECEPSVLDLQAALVDAVSPYAAEGGSPDAFFTDDQDPEIGSTTVEYVETFVPRHVGPGHFDPHVTVGFGSVEEVERLESEPFDRYPIRAEGIAVYQLGEAGTARRELRRWPLT